MKKVVVFFAAMVVVVMFTAAAGANGWTIDRDEARAIRQVVKTIMPAAGVIFSADRHGTCIDIFPGSEIRDIQLTVTVDGCVWIVKRGQGLEDREALPEIKEAIEKIINRPASEALGPGPNLLKEKTHRVQGVSPVQPPRISCPDPIRANERGR